ncbi:ferrous iron transport protein B, partial [[Clostridium] hylemonae DSM 15053]
QAKQAVAPVHEFSQEVEAVLDEIETMLDGDIPEEQKRFYAVKLFERDDKIAEQMKHAPDVSAVIEKAEKDMDDDSESIITNERYNYITSIIGESLKKANKEKLTTSDKIDRVVTNRWLALPIFAVVMWLVYYVSVSTVGTWATDWANDGVFGEGWKLFGLVDVPGIPVIVENGLSVVNCA